RSRRGWRADWAWCWRKQPGWGSQKQEVVGAPHTARAARKRGVVAHGCTLEFSRAVHADQRRARLTAWLVRPRHKAPAACGQGLIPAGNMSHNDRMSRSAKTRQAEQAALDWFGSESAARLMAVEQAELIPALTSVHGRHALYLRPAAASNATLSGHLLGDVMMLHAQGDGSGWDGDLRCADG